MTVEVGDSFRARGAIARSVLGGLVLGLLAAIVFTVDSTVRQPNFEPASFTFAVVWLAPFMLVGGLAFGAIVGLLSGVFALAVRRLPARRVLYFLLFVILSAVAVALVTPDGQWSSGLIARIIVLVCASLVAAFTATRLLPRFAR